MFQFAVYISTVREILRPGVLWFIRDPNDPNFNPMREIFNRPFLAQIRKLIVGVLLYTALVLGIVGGNILLILAWDRYISWTPLTQILPLRWEFTYLISFSDNVSELPLDLLVFHFILPLIWKLLEPRKVFRDFVEWWFHRVARVLCISSFLIGGEYPDEESDDEVDFLYAQEETPGRRVRYMTINPFVRKRKFVREVEEVDSEWEDVDEPGTPQTSGAEQGHMPERRRTEKLRYLRVPNHDHIEVIPGEKMLIRMHENDPVFGRSNETPEDVAANWTKVYAPDHLHMRIFLLVLFHWLTVIIFGSLLLCAPCMLANAVIVGRYANIVLNHYTLVEMPVPADFVFEQVFNSQRHELPAHDVYSYITGIIILSLVIAPIRWVYKKLRHTLFRRNSIRRSSGRNSRARTMGGMVGSDSPTATEQTFISNVALWWTRIGKFQVMAIGKVAYLFVTVVVILPLLFGLCLDLYVLQPLSPHKNVEHIVFFLQDWAIGCIFLKLLYNFLLLIPDNDWSAILNRAVEDGIGRYDLVALTVGIIMPIFSVCITSLVVPLVAKFMEIHYELDSGVITRPVFDYGLLSVVSLLIAMQLLNSISTFISSWIQHVRDDQFLVGQRLHNVD